MKLIDWLLKQDVQINQDMNGIKSERFSDRCWRLRNTPRYQIIRPMVDFIMYPFGGPNHCQRSYESHKAAYPMYDLSP